MTAVYKFHITSKVCNNLYHEFCEYYEKNMTGKNITFNVWLGFIRFSPVAEYVNIAKFDGMYEIGFKSEQDLTFFLLTR